MKVVPGTRGKYRLLIVVEWGKFLALNTGVNTGGRMVAGRSGDETDRRIPAIIDKMMYLLISTSFIVNERVAYDQPAISEMSSMIKAVHASIKSSFVYLLLHVCRSSQAGPSGSPVSERETPLGPSCGRLSSSTT